MPPNIKESVMKAPLIYQPLPPAAANRSFILLTFGGMTGVWTYMLLTIQGTNNLINTAATAVHMTAQKQHNLRCGVASIASTHRFLLARR